MKFKLERIGPIKEAEIELGDITLFLGYPSTGKSYTLRSIYSTLIPLDTAFTLDLKKIIYDSLVNEEMWIKGDYILSYLANLFETNSCYNVNSELESLGKKLELQLQKEVKTLGNECEISVTFSETVDLDVLIQKAISKIKEGLKNGTLRILRESVNYSVSSSISINDLLLSTYINNMNISISNRDLKESLKPLVPFSKTSDKGKLLINKSIKYDEGKNFIELNVSANIKLNNIIKETTVNPNTTLNVIYTPIIKDIFPLDLFVKSIVEAFRVHSYYRSVVFLPYGKSALSVVFNSVPSPKDLATSLGPNIQILFELLKGVFGNWPPIKEPQQLDWTYRSFIDHFNAGKDIIRGGIVNERQNYILDLVTSTTGMKIAVDELDQIYYLLENRPLTPLQVSAMVNEISTLLIPLLDLETPSLIFVEEPEAQLHPAYQLVLAVMLLGLTNMGYNFVISTHSDIFAQFLGELVKYKPSKEKILELLKSIFGDLPSAFDEMVEKAVNALKEIKLYPYYFKEGKVNSVSIDDLVIRIPGITKEVMDKLFYWILEVSENGSREA